MANVNTGGLFRCCVETAINTEGTEGQVIKCKYCKDGKMIFINGTWEWFQLKELRKKYSEQSNISNN